MSAELVSGSPADRIVVKLSTACRMLDISRTRIYALMQQGELQSFKDGKARKIVVASIRDYLDRRLEASKFGGNPGDAALRTAVKAIEALKPAIEDGHLDQSTAALTLREAALAAGVNRVAA